jgi:hypothetical protein
MIRFKVEWPDDVDDQLAAIWIAAPDRAAVTRAQLAIEYELSFDAPQKGVPVAEGLRKLIVPPRPAYFEVDEQKAVVTVTALAVVP